MIGGRLVSGGLLATTWALVGVVGGHLVTYAVLFPDAHVHDAVLRDSGHGWTALLGPAVLTAVVVAVGLGLLGDRRHDHARGVRFATLASLQVGLFAALELGERAASSGLTVETLEHHLTGHGLAAILVVGGLIQLLTAWLGSAVSRLVARVAEQLRHAPRRRRTSHVRLVPVSLSLPAARPVRAHGSRGPPALAPFALPIPWAV